MSAVCRIIRVECSWRTSDVCWFSPTPHKMWHSMQSVNVLVFSVVLFGKSLFCVSQSCLSLFQLPPPLVFFLLHLLLFFSPHPFPLPHFFPSPISSSLPLPPQTSPSPHHSPSPPRLCSPHLRLLSARETRKGRGNNTHPPRMSRGERSHPGRTKTK